MFKSMPIATAALVGLALTATPSLAKNVEVRYADLNLATVEGQKVLEQRIDRAARDACGYGGSVTGTRIPSSQARACYREALDSAKTAMAAKIEAAQDSQLGG